jgi:hypothetical protein
MPSREESIEQASALMAGFAERTGLTSDRPPERYLWTDAFAVCNLLGIARLTGDAHHTQLALQLVDQVHHVLGRFRADDLRSGWLSGLSDWEGESHPTRGGLRIGKALRERLPQEPFDAEREWDRDGQYFHYLAKWMHALDQVTRATGDPRFNLWARELAEVAHARFAHGPRGRRRMYWKLSTDLSRPLVPSMGQHDPLDGYVTGLQLEATAGLRPDPSSALKPALADYASLFEPQSLMTTDSLGLGGLLTEAWRVAQLLEQGGTDDLRLLEGLLVAANAGLALASLTRELRQPASQRLAFRELGLAIGLSALERLRDAVNADRHGVFASPGLRTQLEHLLPQLELGPAIVAFWLAPEHQRARTWSEHRNINEVMLATSLVPEGFLLLLRA